MDGIYRGYHPPATEYADKAMISSEPYAILSEYQSYLMPEAYRSSFPVFGSDDVLSAAASSLPPSQLLPSMGDDEMSNYNYCNHGEDKEDDSSSLIKAKIASHPSYPRLLNAYIDCQKVGAPPEIATFLEEIRRDKELLKQNATSSTSYGADPDLDEFMETYCDMLMKYKSDLEKPFDEASAFLNKVELQLRNLCTGASIRTPSDDGAFSSSSEESECRDTPPPSNEDRELKNKLLQRFGSHISSLKMEFSKKRKKGKLPKEARQALLEWWNIHYKWPYPTEADKLALAESTGLDQKQINNWFINQRKRHWKPSENMQFAVMNNISGQIVTDAD